MTVANNLSALLAQKQIVLWVEDTLTKEYLLRLWQPDEIHFNILVGGGNQTIHAVVHELRQDGYNHVFGLVDRDFGNTNYSQWTNPASKLEVFRPPAFEMENYLLDWPALTGCQENQIRHLRDEQSLVSAAEGRARQMAWWMSCRSVLAKYHDNLEKDFPDHPKIDRIQNQNDAKHYIATENGWHASLSAKTSRITDENQVSSDLQTEYQKWDLQLQNDEWKLNYSGKEIFQIVSGRIIDSGPGSRSEKNTDLAKSVADWQRDHQHIPKELTDLLKSIKQKVGIQ